MLLGPSLERSAKRLVGLSVPGGTGQHWRRQEENRHGRGGQAEYTETVRHAQLLSKVPATTVEAKIAQNRPVFKCALRRGVDCTVERAAAQSTLSLVGGVSAADR